MLHVLFALFFVLVSPADSGEPTVIVNHVYATQALCQEAGAKISKAAQEAVDNKQLEAFYGSCVPVDLDAASKDTHGSI